MGKTDENGLAVFEADPGTYTVHMMKAPEGYVKSDEEFTLDKDNHDATYYLSKEGTEAEPADNKSAESDSVMDFPLTGFTFEAPEEFNHLMGEIRSNDIGEVGDTGVVLGYVAYQAKTEAEAQEYFDTLGVTTVEEITDEVREKMEKFYEDSPTLLLFRVVGVKGDQDLEELKKQMFEFPVLAFDELGTAGDYKFYYVVLDNEEYFEELRNTAYPQDKLDEAYKLWQEAATTSNFKDRVTIKEPVSIYPSTEDGASVSFETQDLDGNPVTSQELFAGHKITMVNLWATWCINCKSEMAELEALNKEWAEKGCQIIGICDDADEEEMIPTAKKILEEKGVTFPNVRTTEAIRDQFPSVGLPTSYFVDSEGKILGKPIVGKNVEQYSETLEQLLSEME
jgi:thiol-disulfide isomerase/thioredoxin